MDNSGSFSAIEAALDDLDQAITALDENAAKALKSQSTIKSLEGDIADLHSNSADLEQKQRANRLTASTSLLLLERADLDRFTAEGDAQSDHVVQAAERAKHLLSETWSAVLKLRKENVINHLLRAFDTSKLFAPVEV
jgi:hypothetical protein